MFRTDVKYFGGWGIPALRMISYAVSHGRLPSLARPVLGHPWPSPAAEPPTAVDKNPAAEIPSRVAETLFFHLRITYKLRLPRKVQMQEL